MAAFGDDVLSAVREGGLSTAVLGDILDMLGYRQQFLPPNIRPIAPELSLAGRAMPVREVDCGEDDRTFGLMFEALDSLGRDEVYVAAAGSPSYALWGELMSTRARSQGAAGAVLDGFVRDTPAIRAMGYPVFATGSYAQDQRGRGRVVEYGVAVRIGAVAVEPGDLLVGDEDGVLCVPSAVAEECVAKAHDKLTAEAEIQREISAGLSASDAFNKYGIM